MGFYPQTNEKPQDNKSKYHRDDFVSALILDSIGAVPSSPGGDIAVSGHVNQMTPITEQTRVRQDKTQIWQPPQFFKTSIFIGNACEVYRNDDPTAQHPPQFRLYDGPDNTTLTRWLADNIFGFNLSYFENESPLGTFTGDPIVMYQGSVGINGLIPSFTLDVNGQAHATAFPVSSDRNLKTDIQPLQNALSKLMQIRGVTFKWDPKCLQLGRNVDPTQTNIGVIAQDVQAVFPELVSTWTNQLIKCKPNGSFMAVDYGRLTPILIEAMRELLDRIQQLEHKINASPPKPK